VHGKVVAWSVCRLVLGGTDHAHRVPTDQNDPQTAAGRSAVQGPGGETGRHAVLRRLCRKASRFESASGHEGSRCHSSSGVEHSIRNRAVVGSIPTCGSEAGPQIEQHVREHGAPSGGAVLLWTPWARTSPTSQPAVCRSRREAAPRGVRWTNTSRCPTNSPHSGARRRRRTPCRSSSPHRRR
jgi:hypothetical protein